MIGRVRRLSLVASALLGAAAIAGAVVRPAHFFRAYLIGWLFWLGIALGSTALLMLYHLVGGMWGHLPRRMFEAGARTLPLLALLFLPMLLGLDRVYAWAGPAAPPLENAAYLNVPFFVLRAAACFAVWIVMAELLWRRSRQQDESGDPRLALALQRLSGPGLVVWAITMTFAGWDWLMSLHPAWESTIFGMTVLVGQALSALAFAIVALRVLQGEAALRRTARAPVFQDLGNLLLALVMVAAYLGFSQYLIIWSGNLADEIVFFVSRARTSWGWIGAALLLFYFFVPFALLLSRRVKRNGDALAIVAAAVLTMRLVELIWLVEPTFSPHGLVLHGLDLVVPAAIGALWLARFTSILGGRPLLAVHDTRVEKAVLHA